MNKTEIEWCDSTWNPVTGCLHECKYCYARRIANRFSGFVEYENPAETREIPCAGLHILNGMQARVRKDGKVVPAAFPFSFEPTLHRYRLDEPQHIKKPQAIFVCSMADLFGDWVPDKWINEVFSACEQAPQHRYMFLTKNPERYMKLAESGMLPKRDNFWYGSSTPDPDTIFWWSDRHNTFVSIEPMLEAFPSAGDCAVKKVDWVIMGAMTGPGSGKFKPKKEWIESLVDDADASCVPVFMKDSLIPIIGKENMRRELPWEEKA